ncbi:MAG TPA: hypothetical protein DDZ81_27050 [Acetobacteraceae bacterium]|jgi:succinoglycan biosynthesis protein ExoW|nr:hypothetical protein [Acetobacteraceae bacterium]
MPSIAVIIPFFARGPSVLARTVRSALHQQGLPTPYVIIVDDGSPQSAAVELAELEPHERAYVRIIQQANAGPAFARNAGLNAVPSETTWVALLDADDTWQPDHLARAVEVLELGYDFYFTNHERGVTGKAHFVHCQFDADAHPTLPVGETAHAFNGDFFTCSLRRTPVGTSTVVYRWETLGDLRFPLFPWAWEDLMFWLLVAKRTTRIAFDATVRVEYDPGGITGADGWRSLAELRRKLWYIQHFANVRNRFRLTSEQAKIVDNECHRHEEGFAIAALGLLKQGTLPERQVLRDFIWLRPKVLVTFIVMGMRQVTKLFGRRLDSAP